VSHSLTLDGLSTEEDFSEVTQAAVLGGTTTVLDCAYQDRGMSLKATLEAWHAKARGRALVDYAFHIVVSDPSERALGEFRDIVENEGVSSFKVFLGFKDRWMLDDASFFRLLQKAREIPALVVVHPENGCVTRFLQNYAIRHDNVSFAHYAQASPCILEGEAIHRAVAFARSQLSAVCVPDDVQRGARGCPSRSRSRSGGVRRDAAALSLVQWPSREGEKRFRALRLGVRRIEKHFGVRSSKATSIRWVRGTLACQACLKYQPQGKTFAIFQRASEA